MDTNHEWKVDVTFLPARKVDVAMLVSKPAENGRASLVYGLVNRSHEKGRDGRSQVPLCLHTSVHPTN